MSYKYYIDAIKIKEQVLLPYTYTLLRRPVCIGVENI